MSSSLHLADFQTSAGSSAKPNEDLWGCSHDKRTVWLLDGATGTAPKPLVAEQGDSDAAWLVRQMDHFLTTEAGKHDSLPKLVRSVLENVRNVFNDAARIKDFPIEHAPLASGVILRLHGVDQVEVASLGGCRTLIETTDQDLVTIGGNAVQQGFEARTFDAMMAHRDATGEAELAKLRPAALHVINEQRRAVNTPDGYWLFGLNLDAADNMALSRHTVRGEIVLTTNGLYALVDKYNAYATDRRFLDAVQAEGLNALIEQARAIEKDDPNAQAYPRVKQKDDATGARLSLRR